MACTTPKDDMLNRHVSRVATGALAAATAVGALVVSSPAPAEAAPHSVWVRIARCESGGDPHINTGNGYYGYLQISLGTWRANGGRRYASYPHRASKGQQIAVGERIVRSQGWGAWPRCASFMRRR